MAHYDLYRSIGLDRSKDPQTLAHELDQRIQSGNATNPGGVEELRIARNILGDPQRRTMYDQRLDHPYSPEITVDALRDLAGVGQPQPQPQPQPQKQETVQLRPREPERPRQHFPDTDPNMHEVKYEAPQFSEPKKKKKAWPWALAAVVLLAAAGGGGYWWYTQYGGPTEPWEDEDLAIAEAFPELISAEDGGRGFNGMRCHHKEVAGDEIGKIRCANPKAGVSVFKYESQEARDATIPSDGDTQRFGNDSCEITSTKIKGQDLPTFLITPDGDFSTYSFLINGKDAEELRVQLPIC